MDRSRILIIEDHEDAREAMRLALSKEFDVHSVGSAEKALESLNEKEFDLIIMDVGLPGMDGYKLCASLKSHEKHSEIPVIFLTGRMDLEDKLLGFSVGAQDFVSKPVDLRELRARVSVHTQKRKEELQKSTQIQVGPFQVDTVTQAASYRHEGKTVDIKLSPLEFKLLYFFLTHIDHVLTRDQLLDRVWGDSRHVNDRSVDALTSKLRQKLGPYGDLIQATTGVGYRFLKPPQVVPSDKV